MTQILRLNSAKLRTEELSHLTMPYQQSAAELGFPSREPLMKEPVYRRWPQHALKEGMRKFARIVGLNETASSNVPSKADITGRARTSAAWHYSAAKRVRAWVVDAGASQR